MTGLFLFNFKTTHCKNHFDINLVKQKNGGHLGMPNCKKSKWVHTRNILAQSWINFNQWFLKYCHFHVDAIFSKSPWRPSWKVNLHKFVIDPLKKIKTASFGHNPLSHYWDIFIFKFCAIFSNSKWRPSWNAKLQKTKTASCKKHSGTKWINFNQWFLRYRHFGVDAIFSTSPWRPSWIVNLHKFVIDPLKKIKTASHKKHSGTKLDQFHLMVLEILSFPCLCYF